MVQAAPAIAWVIGNSEPPDELRTTEFYEALIKHCSKDGCAAMAALGATIASKFLAPTVADHKSNVTYEALRQLLSELGLPCDADALVLTIAKYLGPPGKPFKMKAAPALDTHVQAALAPRARVNERFFQKHRQSIGRELGDQGLDQLKRDGLPPHIFRVAPTGRQLKQPEVTKIKDDVRKWAIIHYDNLYADHEFLETLAGLLEVSHPKLNQRKGSDTRSWRTVLFNGWENGAKSKVRAVPHARTHTHTPPYHPRQR